jgi:hypothetical protein
MEEIKRNHEQSGSKGSQESIINIYISTTHDHKKILLVFLVVILIIIAIYFLK